jgi:hypothetical protein
MPLDQAQAVPDQQRHAPNKANTPGVKQILHGECLANSCASIRLRLRRLMLVAPDARPAKLEAVDNTR